MVVDAGLARPAEDVDLAGPGVAQVRDDRLGALVLGVVVRGGAMVGGVVLAAVRVVAARAGTLVAASAPPRGWRPRRCAAPTAGTAVPGVPAPGRWRQSGRQDQTWSSFPGPPAARPQVERRTNCAALLPSVSVPTGKRIGRPGGKSTPGPQPFSLPGEARLAARPGTMRPGGHFRGFGRRGVSVTGPANPARTAHRSERLSGRPDPAPGGSAAQRSGRLTAGR